MSELLGFFFLLVIIAGFIGFLIGSTVKKGVGGFFLGFFLGPIGWIIVLLLPRENKTVHTQPPAQISPPADAHLDNDEYKIWLVQTYEIKRNEVLDSYVCNEKLFKTIDLALDFAHSLEIKARAQAHDEEKKRIENIERIRKDRIENIAVIKRASQKNWKNIKIKARVFIVAYRLWGIGLACLTLVGIATFVYEDVLEATCESPPNKVNYDPTLIAGEKFYRGALLHYLKEYEPTISNISKKEATKTDVRFTCLNGLTGNIKLTLNSCMGTISRPFSDTSGASGCDGDLYRKGYLSLPIELDPATITTEAFGDFHGLNRSGREFFSDGGVLSLNIIKSAEMEITGTYQPSDWSIRYDSKAGKAYPSSLIEKITIPITLNKE